MNMTITESDKRLLSFLVAVLLLLLLAFLVLRPLAETLAASFPDVRFVVGNGGDVLSFAGN